MSNHKHLADLLKVCSILPALAIMPAMASNDPNLSDNAFVLGDVVTNETIWGGVRIESDDPMVLAWPEYKMVARSFDLTGIKGGKKVYFGPIDLTVRELADDEEFAWNSQRYDESGNPIDFDLAKYNTDGSERDKQVVWNNANGVEELGAMDRFLTRDDSKEAGKVTVTSSDVIMAGSKITAKEIVFNDSSLNIIKDLPELAITSDGVAEIFADELDVKGNSQIVVAPGTQLDIQGADIEIETADGGVHAESNAVINIATGKAGEIDISSINGEAIIAYNNGQVNIGGADTESVDISSVNNNAIYTAYYASFADKKNSVTNVMGKDISISTQADGLGAIHVASNDITVDDANVATVNITGDNIKIFAPETDVYQGVAIVAMSKGVANIEGNTTIRAQNAILARGDAQVNINKSGENTVKMLGDINFNYKKAMSDSAVDANIDVTLAGADSFWTGNTIVSWDDVMPDPEKLVVSNAKITLKDGAVWNATAIEDRMTDAEGFYRTALNDLIIDGGTVNIADTERGIFVDRIDADNATFNGGMLNVNETIDITSGTTVFNSAVLGEAGVLNLAEGATLDIGTSTVDLAQLNINGTVLASVLSDRSYGSLSGEIDGDGKVQLNVGSVGSYKIFDSQADITVTAGATYDVSQEADGTVVITTKAVEDIAADTGLTAQAAGAIAGLANATDKNLQKVSLAAQQVLNSGDVAAVERETKKLNPTDKPVAQATAASVQNQVLSLTSGRMAGGVSVGRAGGDAVSKENGFWMQGLFNKSKLADEFNGYTRGFALGADLLIDNKWTIGGGLAVNDSDVRSNSADIDIDSKTVFLYGQYKPNNWFVNATATYSMSEYTENKNPFGVMSGAAYDVESYGVQAMGGYDFAAGITAEAGLRYLHIAQDAYTDDLGFKVKATDTDFLSGVAGLKYAFAIENDWKVRLRPELRAAMTYDFISDDIVATVAMPGVASYKVDVERLSRMGGEFGIGLTALYRGMEVSLMYDLDLHKDYTSQTGMIKFRGRF